MKKVPKLTMLEYKEAENFVPTFHRLVDYKECFLYGKNLTVNYLYYMRNF